MFFVLVSACVILLRGHQRPACLQVDSLGPVHCRIEFVRGEKLAAAPVEHVGEAVAIKMGEGRNGYCPPI